ncbi:MAG: hypothetical protein AAGG09_01740 [Pseudomonadota bacterium]
MDPVSITYYALVCGVLAGFLPPRMGRLAKIAVGIAVGLIAAAILPALRALAGM